MNSHYFRLLILVLFLLLLSSCAAGDPQFTSESPAGFWYGLWHGAISFIALIIHLFNENVAVYEINNTGGWYDFGFLLGVIAIWGNGCRSMKCRFGRFKKRDKEWDEINKKVEIKIMRKLKDWAEDEESGVSGKEWDEIGEKVEKKLKRIIREWAEKD